MLLTAGQLLLAHWPALLTLAFLGAALRSGALWLAVVVSDHVSFLAQIILTLAPLGFLLPVIAMLHLCRDSLPSVRELDARPGPEAASEKRERRLVDVAVSMLVPFLAVYVSYGLLKQDQMRFVNEAAFQEFNQFKLGKPAEYDYADRVGLYSGLTIVVIVAVAWVARWALGRMEHGTKFLGLAFVGALVEVYYTGQGSRYLAGTKAQFTDWLENRRATDATVEWYEAVRDRLGWLASPIDHVTGWLFDLLGSVDAVVVVPIAWLTVGAVVLGHKLSPPAAPEHPDRFARVPPRVKAMGASLFADVRTRWSAFWGGLRLLSTAGLLPMLVFGLVFLVAIRIPLLISQLLREVIGPVRTETWLAFNPMEAGLGFALSMALTAPLLAAAINWLLAGQLTDSPEPADGEDAAAMVQSGSSSTT